MAVNDIGRLKATAVFEGATLHDIALTRDVGHDDREMVGAQACHELLVRRACKQPFGHASEQLVSCGTSQRVIDRLESFQVDHHDRELAAVGGRGGDQSFEPFSEQDVVGEPGESVVVRQEVQSLLLVDVVQRERNVAHEFHEQLGFLNVEGASHGGEQREHADASPRDGERKTCKRVVAFGQQSAAQFGD